MTASISQIKGQPNTQMLLSENYMLELCIWVSQLPSPPHGCPQYWLRCWTKQKGSGPHRTCWTAQLTRWGWAKWVIEAHWACQHGLELSEAEAKSKTKPKYRISVRNLSPGSPWNKRNTGNYSWNHLPPSESPRKGESHACQLKYSQNLHSSPSITHCPNRSIWNLVYAPGTC